MQMIRCPWCGPREEVEFHYGGQAHVPYPAEPAALSDEEWAHYVFFRDNTRGVFAERWSHSAGCRRWFNALRDTVSSRFLAVYRPGDPRPEVDAAGQTDQARRQHRSQTRDQSQKAGASA